MVADALMPEILPSRGTAADTTPDSHPSSMILDASAASQGPAHDCDPSPDMDPASDVEPTPSPLVDLAGSPSALRALSPAPSVDSDAGENGMLLDEPTPPALPSPPVMTLMPSNSDADDNDALLDSPMPPPPALPPPPILALAPFPSFPNLIPPSQS
ncbi:hypothetical protein AMAG_17871 [Allomyces macrogynus ATCC 38327]|uniref:Uncharacterized protein n=1 Tax=Allomyces macrogynus (strain ATCC 38327) TaxID=578462 RepID=A0A0L0S0H9_ALLM3|nr:hypothetical protein AMAG_17871 [Allomyces macrogynus ATCC 38327]|eukprot:KNE56122.1 hypothetical protein AMAG_17871 [Allomyces macrogynus ATCC 38327]